MRFKGQKDEFESMHRLGAGGMAEVLFGQSVSDPNKAVAIKVPLPDLEPEVRALFLREAAAAQRVQDARVVPVVDYGDAIGETPPFIAFEFVDAPTLGKEISTRAREARAMNVGEFVRLAFDLIAALETINQVVVHRDVKPDNVFVTPSGVRVADFGIAKYLDEATRTKTFKGAGSLPYMAPELLVGGSASLLSDQYAVGVTLYEAAALSLPFTATDTSDLIQQIKFRSPQHVSDVARAIPRAVGNVIARMMSKEARSRFPTWADVRKAMEVAIGGVAGDSTNREDPLLGEAVRRLQAKESAELAERERIEAAERVRRERRDLAEYWRERILKAFEARIAALNAALARQAIDLQKPIGGARRADFGFSFLGNQVDVRVEAVPLELMELDKDALVTGCLYGKGPGRYIVAHLLVLRDESPYGNPREVTLRASAILADPRRAVSRAPSGAEYEVPGEAIVARNALALLYQRQYRRGMHTVDWEEKSFDLDATVAEFMEFVVKTEGPAK